MNVILPFLGVIIGAALQFLFTRLLEDRRHRRELRTKAYTDYLKCVSDHANLDLRQRPAEVRELGSRTADAKCRICLYGSAKVINGFAEFEKLGATMNTPEQMSAFTTMVARMRADSAGGEQVLAKELQSVLLGYR